MLNLALMRNPWNWVTIMLMVIIGSFAINAGVKLISRESN